MVNTKNIPIRWTGPEVFENQKFYLQSDVWSFGILIFEIFSDGSKPYISLDNQQVIELICEKKQSIEPPQNCPPKNCEINEIMFAIQISAKT